MEQIFLHDPDLAEFPQELTEFKALSGGKTFPPLPETFPTFLKATTPALYMWFSSLLIKFLFSPSSFYAPSLSCSSLHQRPQCWSWRYVNMVSEFATRIFHTLWSYLEPGFVGKVSKRRKVQTTEGGGCHGNILTCHVASRESKRKYLSNVHVIFKSNICLYISMSLINRGFNSILPETTILLTSAVV